MGFAPAMKITRARREDVSGGAVSSGGKGEINELVNLPDILGMEIAINGEVFPRYPAEAAA
ncbi:hypothetical protein OHD50_03225 [Escherichia coli]|nr:hypothetical protein [Escherichia coli]